MFVLKKFVLDSDVFIAAHRGYYAFDIAPGFWTKLLTRAQSDIIVSITEVLGEIKDGFKKEPDDLGRWATNDFRPYFDRVDQQDVLAAYTKVIDWVCLDNSYSDAAKQKFASVADGWLIAYALAKDVCLVTNENKRNKKGRVTIPDVCEHFGIEYINTYDMMRRIGITLK